MLSISVSRISGKFCADADAAAPTVAVVTSPQTVAILDHLRFSSDDIVIGNVPCAKQGVRKLEQTLVRGLNAVNASLDGAGRAPYKASSRRIKFTSHRRRLRARRAGIGRLTLRSCNGRNMAEREAAKRLAAAAAVINEGGP